MTCRYIRALFLVTLLGALPCFAGVFYTDRSAALEDLRLSGKVDTCSNALVRQLTGATNAVREYVDAQDLAYDAVSAARLALTSASDRAYAKGMTNLLGSLAYRSAADFATAAQGALAATAVQPDQLQATSIADRVYSDTVVSNLEARVVFNTGSTMTGNLTISNANGRAIFYPKRTRYYDSAGSTAYFDMYPDGDDWYVERFPGAPAPDPTSRILTDDNLPTVVGSAAYSNASDFATAAQGVLAGTALQPASTNGWEVGTHGAFVRTNGYAPDVSVRITTDTNVLVVSGGAYGDGTYRWGGGSANSVQWLTGGGGYTNIAGNGFVIYYDSYNDGWSMDGGGAAYNNGYYYHANSTLTGGWFVGNPWGSAPVPVVSYQHSTNTAYSVAESVAFLEQLTNAYISTNNQAMFAITNQYEPDKLMWIFPDTRIINAEGGAKGNGYYVLKRTVGNNRYYYETNNAAYPAYSTISGMYLSLQPDSGIGRIYQNSAGPQTTIMYTNDGTISGTWRPVGINPAPVPTTSHPTATNLAWEVASNALNAVISSGTLPAPVDNGALSNVVMNSITGTVSDGIANMGSGWLKSADTNGFIRLADVPADNLAWQSNAVDSAARATNTAQDAAITGKVDTTSLGTAAYSNASAFATSAQGALADTSLQRGTNAVVLETTWMVTNAIEIPESDPGNPNDAPSSSIHFLRTTNSSDRGSHEAWLYLGGQNGGAFKRQNYPEDVGYDIYDSGNFVSGTHYLSPSGNGSNLVGITAAQVGAYPLTGNPSNWITSTKAISNNQTSVYLNLDGPANGFEDQYAQTLTYLPTRQCVVTPTGTVFRYTAGNVTYSSGTVTSPALPVASGNQFFYFRASDGAFIATNTAWGITTGDAQVLYVLYDGESTNYVYTIDERHGVRWPDSVHDYMHKTRGAALASGITLAHNAQDTLAAAGANGTQTVVAVTDSGDFRDEDIVHTTVANGTSANSTNTAGQFPIMYKTNGVWKKIAPTPFPFLWAGNVPEYVPSTGVRTSVAEDQYFVYWMVAAGGIDGTNLYLVPHPFTYSSTTLADQGATIKNLSDTLGGFPSAEILVCYRMIFQFNAAAAGANPTSVKSAKLRKVDDYRGIAAGLILAGTGSSGGISADSLVAVGGITNVSINGTTGTVAGGIADLGTGYLTNSHAGAVTLYNTVTVNSSLTATGGLNVGTSALAVPLSVGASKSANFVAYLYNLANDGYGLRLRNGNDANASFQILNSGGTAGNIAMYGDGKATFNGNVGINTNTPSERLHVNGNVLVESNTTIRGAVTLGSNLVVIARKNEGQATIVNDNATSTSADNCSLAVVSSNRNATLYLNGHPSVGQTVRFQTNNTTVASIGVLTGTGNSLVLKSGNDTEGLRIVGTNQNVICASNLTVGGSITLGGVAQSSWPAGGGSIYTNFSSIPAAGTAGRIAFFSDSEYTARDNGNSWDYFFCGQKVVLPVTNGWTFTSVGAATVSLSGGSLIVSATNNYSMLTNIPPTPYSITALIGMGPFADLYSGNGLAFSDGTKYSVAYHAWDSSSSANMWSLYSIKFSTLTAFSATYGFKKTPPSLNPIWVKLSDDGTNRMIYASQDNRDYQLIHSVAQTDYLTPSLIGLWGRQVGSESYKYRCYSLEITSP